MTIREMALEWLKANKMDGLLNEGECGCKLDDLIPCDLECTADCEAVKFKDCEECDHGFVNQNGIQDCSIGYAFCTEEP